MSQIYNLTGKKKSLVGEQFGEWTVIAKDIGNYSSQKWHCMCSCGGRYSVWATSLKSMTSVCCKPCSLKRRRERTEEKSTKIYSTHFIVKLLKRKIDAAIKPFLDYNNKIKTLNDEIEKIEIKMHSIVVELEPLEFAIYKDYPHLQSKFESLKRIYGDSNDKAGTNN